MTKIDIFSGFLGAGKTTLIKKLIKEAYAGERVVLIENEFGEIGIDGGFLQDAGIEITEMNSGCICCSLVGDFTKALEQVLVEFKPDRIIIEPSGVGKLSDVIRAAEGVVGESASLNCFTTVVDAGKCKMYMKNFGEFFNDQIEHASAVILSHTDVAKPHKVEEAVKLVREHNADAVIIATPWASLTGAEILSAMENKDTLASQLESFEKEHREHHHEHDEHCGCHDHEHHHEHGEHCGCGCHHDHGHHHADEVFASFGAETTKVFTVDELNSILEAFSEDSDYGMILRAKGIVAGEGGKWIHFDYVPDETNVRFGSAAIIGRLCVIGSGINNEKIKELFGI
jgi:G3E family GTPase